MQRKWRISLIVCVGVFMSSLDLFIVNIAFPAISVHFGGVSLGSLSWVLSGYAIVFAALLVPAGRWADAFGRKRAFLLGLAIFVLASAGCALAPSVGVLIAARVVQAAGGALMLPTSLGLMLPEFGPHERAPGDRRVGGDGRDRGRRRTAARRPARAGRLAAGVPRERPRRPDRPRARTAYARRAPRSGSRAPGCARRGGADRGDRLARRGDREGPGMGLGLAGDPCPSGSDRSAAAGDLVALGAPSRAGGGARRCCACAASAWLSPARFCSSAASGRCCWRACCS